MQMLYEDIGYDDVVGFELVGGVGLYSLKDLAPSVTFDNIESITISEEPENISSQQSIQSTYTRSRPSDALIMTHRVFYKVDEDTIGFYPIPRTTGQVCRIFHQAKPREVTVLTDEIEMREEFVTAIIYYVMSVIAEAQEDSIKYNNFINQYNAERLRIKKRKYSLQGKLPTTTDTGLKPMASTRRRRGLVPKRDSRSTGGY
jgi:hypothetical protein